MVFERGLSDPRLSGTMVTVTGVNLSQDLANATITVSVLPAKKESAAIHAIQAASAHIRREAGDRVSLSRMPQLAFRLDHALKNQAGVLEALAKVREEDLARHPQPEPGPEALGTNDTEENPA